MTIAAVLKLVSMLGPLLSAIMAFISSLSEEKKEAQRAKAVSDVLRADPGVVVRVRKSARPRNS